MKASDSGYFHRLAAQSPTEFWINNPTFAEGEAAVAAGAVCATTNPTYLSRLLKEEPEYVADLIDEASQEAHDDGRIADLVYQKAVVRLLKLFLPLYKKTGGRRGFVAVQGDPRVNSDPEAILEGAMRYVAIGENIIVKVPSWPAGAVALERLVERGIPTIATLGFSVDQAVYVAEVYRRALHRTRKPPGPCFVTFIAGVLDTYLVERSALQGNVVSADAIRQAGCEASRAAYRIYQSRAYEAILLGGGARGPHHFTELVGGELAITIGWNLAQQIIASGAAIIPRIDAATPESVLSELERHLPDFRKAYRENSLSPEEFHGFGPVSAFQGSFLAGMETILKAIAARKGPAASGITGR